MPGNTGGVFSSGLETAVRVLIIEKIHVIIQHPRSICFAFGTVGVLDNYKYTACLLWGQAMCSFMG